ncbi:MAG: hypothetical protein ACLTDR_04415 [Adlercreutzia equolifaciens]
MRLFGQAIEPGSAALDALKARIGIVFDTCAFPSTARVKEVGAIGRAAYATWDEVRWNELLAAFKLTPKKKVSELSRGMGMKLDVGLRAGPPPAAARAGRGHGGARPLGPRRGARHPARLRGRGRPGHPHVHPHHLRPGEDRRRNRLREQRRSSCFPPRRTPSPTRPAWLAAAPPRWRPCSPAALWPRAPPACCATTTAWMCSCPTASPSPAPSPTWWWTEATIEDYMTLTLKGESR